MMVSLERRRAWSRIVGVERRSAPIQDLEGHPLPDPTLLEDEDFLAVRQELEKEKAGTAQDRGNGLNHSD